MKLRKTLSVAIFSFAFLVAATAVAKSKRSNGVSIPLTATIAGSHIESGSYNIRWETHSPEATVTFLQGSKVVATAEGKAVHGGKTYLANEIVYDQGADGGRVIREIHFIGSNEILVFNH